MYRPCYAPVFAPSSALDCALQHIRLSVLLVFLVIALLITFGSERIMCLIRQTRYRMEHCREGNNDPAIDLGFTLDRWIRETPPLRAAIIWRPDDTTALPYSRWSRDDKRFLAALYDILKERSDAGLPEEPGIAGFRYYDEGRGDRANPVTVVGYATDIAKQTFFAHVAQSLLVEVEERVPWRLSRLSRDHLAYLFDSQHMYDWSESLGLLSLHAFLGKATPGDPGRVYEWLRSNGLIRSSTRFTIIALLEWCRGLSHDAGIGPPDNPDVYPGSRDGNEAHWQYEGFPPVERTARGTIRNLYTEPRHWTHGCQGTTGFLRNLLRTVNIPVKREDGCGHAIPHFLEEGVFLSHGDDPYGTFMKNYTPRIAMEEILIDTEELDGFFADCDNSNVGLGVVRAVMRLLPDQLLEMECRDRAAGLARPEGEVYAFFDRFYTLSELESERLWERLGEEIARRGGCSMIVGPG